MIRSVKAMEQELINAVLKKELNVEDLKFTGYKNGSLMFLGVDKELKYKDLKEKTVIRLDAYNWSLYQTWETSKDMEFHIGYLD